MTPVLQSANFPVARWEDCFEAYEQIHNRRLNVRTQLCAGSEGNDACAGDSGGALVVRPRDGRNNVYYQECILFRTWDHVHMTSARRGGEGVQELPNFADG